MLRQLSAAMATTTRKVPIPKNGVDYRGKVVLAPMVRSGELPSRLLALKYGADLVWGPETVDRSMIGTTSHINPYTGTLDFTRLSSNAAMGHVPDKKESIIYRLHPTREGKKLIFQIGTASPETAVQAAKLVAPHVAGIDVNAGCPKPFSTIGGMGAALLQDPDRLASILSALVKEVGEVYEIGISVKIRLLETPEKTAALVRKLCQTGITGLTVHCRTTPMRPRERAIRDQLRMIGELCREEGVACLMNGDVKNKDEATHLSQEYGVDGGMIATAAEANSSAFRTEAEGGLLPWRKVVHEYMNIALEVDNKWGNTKFLLSQLMPGKAQTYQRVAMTKNYEEACRCLEFNEYVDRARDVDDRLGISVRQREAKNAAIQKAKSESKAAKAASKAAQILQKQPQKKHISERGVAMSAAMAV